MISFKTFCFFIVFVLGFSITGFSQDSVVTDRNGTTFLRDVLPPSSPIRRAPSRRSHSKGHPAPIIEAPQEQLVHKLCGVVLVKPSDVRPRGWSGIEGVWHDFNDFPAEAGWAIQKYLGKPASLQSLDRLVVDVLTAYRESGRPVVDISLPEQDITSGVVQLVVIESNLARVRIEGADVETEEYIRSQLRVRKGEVIRSEDVLHDLAWLNRNPHRKIDLAYAPGSQFGTTDVILKASETGNSTKWNLGYDDSGTQFLGRDRINAGVSIGELGRPGRSLAYQYSTDLELDRVRQHSVVYSQDLPWRHNLTFLASFVDINTEFPVVAFAPPVQSTGLNWQLSARYNIPLRSKDAKMPGPLFHDFQRDRDLHFGFDFKSNENDLEFGGITAILGDTLNTQTEIYQFSVGYKEVWHHQRAVSQFDVTGYYSPGGFSNHNSIQAFQESRAGSDPNYAYVRAHFEHQRHLLQNWSIRAKAGAQLASDNLQASEQVGAGGFDIGRGFDQRVIRGDQGLWGTFELYSPELSLANSLGWQNATDKLRLLSFVDAAGISNVDTIEGEPDNQTIASVGVGMRYNYNDCYDIRIDYGHPVMSENIDNIDTSGRFHIGATTTF